jgi:hypothetical protein
MGWPNDENITIKIADIHIHLHSADEGDAETFRQSVTTILGIIKTNTEKIMSSLDDDIGLVQAETTQIAGVTTLLTSINQQLSDALSGVTLPPAVQAKVDAVFTGLTANSGALAAAIALGPTGTPLPPPPPAPVVTP